MEPVAVVANVAGRGDAASSVRGNSINVAADTPLLLQVPQDEAVSMDYTGPLDPRRMLLTSQERRWALAIREAIHQNPKIDPVSDFVCAQLALTCADNVEDALWRASGLQTFRQEYSVLDSLAEGCRLVKDLVGLFPELYLSLSYAPSEHRYTLAYDLSKHSSQTIKDSHHNFITWIKSGYYMAVMMNPDLAACRNGVNQIVECEGYQIHKNLDFTYFRKMHEELLNVYPQKMHKVQHFHTGVFVNLMTSMAKRFLPEEHHNKFQFGCQFDGRLNTFFHVPDVPTANQKLLARIEDNLQRHYANEQAFKL